MPSDDIIVATPSVSSWPANWIMRRQRSEATIVSAREQIECNLERYLDGEIEDRDSFLREEARLRREISDAIDEIASLPHGPVPFPDPPRKRKSITRKLRKRIYERDEGRCQVCSCQLPFDAFECGHIVDHCAGGDESFENLVVMCWNCNRMKPWHDTRDEFDAWMAAGAWLPGVLEILRERR